LGCLKLHSDYYTELDKNSFKYCLTSYKSGSEERSDYLYGFNGMEHDDEIKGDLNAYDFGSRSIYDGRLGRFVSVDPKMRDFAWRSPYSFAGNSPVQNIDNNGEEEVYYMLSIDGNTGNTTFRVAKDDNNASDKAYYQIHYSKDGKSANRTVTREVFERIKGSKAMVGKLYDTNGDLIPLVGGIPKQSEKGIVDKVKAWLRSWEANSGTEGDSNPYIEDEDNVDGDKEGKLGPDDSDVPIKEGENNITKGNKGGNTSNEETSTPNSDSVYVDYEEVVRTKDGWTKYTGKKGGTRLDTNKYNAKNRNDTIKVIP